MRRHRRVPGGAVIRADAPERQRVELGRHDDRAAGGRASPASKPPGRARGTAASRRGTSSCGQRVAAGDVARPRSTGWRALSGTRFGRPVLPLVCRISATSSTSGRRPPVPEVATSGTLPAASVVDRQHRTRSPAAGALRPRRRAAAAGRGRWCPRGRSGTRLPCSRIERRRGAGHRGREKRDDRRAGRSAAPCRRDRRGGCRRPPVGSATSFTCSRS